MKNEQIEICTFFADTLEQVVGIQNVVQCHGSFATATCMKCKNKVDAEIIREDIFAQKIPHCPQCVENQNRATPEHLPQVQENNSEDQQNSGEISVVQQPSIMKPDIVFFGEGLGDEFHTAVAKDKDEVDLLIMIGSSLKVRPVALIPSSIDASVPQVCVTQCGNFRIFLSLDFT